MCVYQISFVPSGLFFIASCYNNNNEVSHYMVMHMKIYYIVKSFHKIDEIIFYFFY